MPLLDDSEWALKEVFGWEQPPRQVLPHENQALRGSKLSVKAKDAVPKEVWEEVLSANAFDVLLYHWARRMYLERRACRYSSNPYRGVGS
ncbi:unnamed protein product [Choristocarpus tenellus]